MPHITFILKDGTRVEADAPIGLSIMEIANRAGVAAIEGACGGSLSCATCHGYVQPAFFDKSLPEDGARSDEEEDMLDLAFDVRATSRLTCQILMREDLDGMEIAVPGCKNCW